MNMLDGREDAASVSRAMAGSRLWTDLPGTRIFCLILAGDHEWGVKQEVVKQTWAQRCDNYCFFYSVSSRPFYFFLSFYLLLFSPFFPIFFIFFLFFFLYILPSFSR